MSEAKTNWAMGTPAVLYMVGCACIMLFALLYGLVNPGAIPLVAVVFIVCGIATLILGKIELARGDILLGSIDMVFGALIFMGLGVVLATVAWSWANLAGAPAILQPDLKMAAFLSWGIAIALLLFLPNVGKVSWSLFLFFLVLAVGVALVGVGLWSGANFGDPIMKLGGILVLLFGLFGYYAGTVFITNTVYQAPKLPIGGPLFK